MRVCIRIYVHTHIKMINNIIKEAVMNLRGSRGQWRKQTGRESLLNKVFINYLILVY